MKPFYHKDGCTIYNGNCLEILPFFAERQKKFHLVLTDPPYGITACEWDRMPDLDVLWGVLKPIGNENTAYVFTASQPFTSKLVLSNLAWFKYEWVWDKINKFSGHLNSKKQPMRQTERILCFYNKQCVYNPIMEIGKPYTAISSGAKSSNYGQQTDKIKTVCNGERYPRDIIRIKGDERGTVGRIHPTQKPVVLMEYLIKTYTNEGNIILDPFMGSGTTLVAAKNLNRRCVGIEISEKYCQIAVDRLG